MSEPHAGPLAVIFKLQPRQKDDPQSVHDRVLAFRTDKLEPRPIPRDPLAKRRGHRDPDEGEEESGVDVAGVAVPVAAAGQGVGGGSSGDAMDLVTEAAIVSSATAVASTFPAASSAARTTAAAVESEAEAPVFSITALAANKLRTAGIQFVIANFVLLGTARGRRCSALCFLLPSVACVLALAL